MSGFGGREVGGGGDSLRGGGAGRESETTLVFAGGLGSRSLPLGEAAGDGEDEDPSVLCLPVPLACLAILDSEGTVCGEEHSPGGSLCLTTEGELWGRFSPRYQKQAPR